MEPREDDVDSGVMQPQAKEHLEPPGAGRVRTSLQTDTVLLIELWKNRFLLF
jgi:hypothetical protein